MKHLREINTLCFSPGIEGHSWTMDLFGDIDDISSESDGDSEQSIPGQPAVSIIINLNRSHGSK